MPRRELRRGIMKAKTKKEVNDFALEIYREGIDFSARACSAVAILTLNDKFDFTKEDLIAFLKLFDTMFGDILEDRLTLADAMLEVERLEIEVR